MGIISKLKRVALDSVQESETPWLQNPVPNIIMLEKLQTIICSHHTICKKSIHNSSGKIR